MNKCLKSALTCNFKHKPGHKERHREGTHLEDADLMLQFSLLLPQLNQLPLSSSIAVFTLISFS